MTKIYTDQTILTDIANAVRNQTHTKNSYTPSEIVTAINNFDPSLEDITNASIKSYKTRAENINANTFVNLLDWTETDATDLSQDNTNWIQSIGSVKASLIDTNKIFVWHYKTYVSGDYEYKDLYGTVLTINGTTITKGTSTAIQTGHSSNVSIFAKKLIKIATNKVVVVYEYYVDGNTPVGYYRCSVCSISGTTITVGSYISLGSSLRDYDLAKVDTNKIIFGYEANDDYYTTYCKIGTVSGTSISWGTSVSTTTDVGIQRFAAINVNKVFQLISSTKCRILTISGTTITIGTAQVIRTVSTAYAELLDTDKIICGGCIFTISGTVITQGQVCSGGGSLVSVIDKNTLLLTDNTKFIIGHVDAYDFITYENGINISLTGFHVLLNDDGNIITIVAPQTTGSFTKTYLSAAFVASYKNLVKTTDNPLKIYGITKTQCTPSTAGEVWVLNNN